MGRKVEDVYWRRSTLVKAVVKGRFFGSPKAAVKEDDSKSGLTIQV